MRCFFHQWDKWEQYEIQIEYTPGIIAPKEIRGKMFQTTELRQRRRCKKCNKLQDKLVRGE